MSQWLASANASLVWREGVRPSSDPRHWECTYTESVSCGEGAWRGGVANTVIILKSLYTKWSLYYQTGLAGPIKECFCIFRRIIHRHRAVEMNPALGFALLWCWINMQRYDTWRCASYVIPAGRIAVSGASKLSLLFVYYRDSIRAAHTWTLMCRSFGFYGISPKDIVNHSYHCRCPAPYILSFNWFIWSEWRIISTCLHKGNRPSVIVVC